MNEIIFDEQDLLNKIILSVHYSHTSQTWENVANIVNELDEPLNYDQISYLIKEADVAFPTEFTFIDENDKKEKEDLIFNILKIVYFRFDQCPISPDELDEVTYNLLAKIMNCFAIDLKYEIIYNIVDIVMIILNNYPSKIFLDFLISVNYQDKICDCLMCESINKFPYLINMIIGCLYKLIKKLPQDTNFLSSLCTHLLSVISYETEDDIVKLVCYVFSNFKSMNEIIFNNYEFFISILQQTESYQEIRSICKMNNYLLLNDVYLEKLLISNYPSVLIEKIKFAKNSSRAFRYIIENIVNICNHSINGCELFINLGIFDEKNVPNESFLYKKSMISVIKSMTKYDILPMKYQSTIEDIIASCLESDDEDVISQTLDLIPSLYTKSFTFDIEPYLENLINNENQEISSKAIVFYSSYSDKNR